MESKELAAINLTNKISDEDETADDNNRVLVDLISQLERLEADDKLEKADLLAEIEDSSSSATVGITKPESKTPNVVNGSSTSETENEEIIKEIKKLKRQNFVTHCLLSAMIVLTVVWQLSEVSLILKVKDRVHHPFRSFGNLFNGMLKHPNDGEEGEKQSRNDTVMESSSLPAIKIPDLSQIEMPDLNFNGNHE